MCNNNCMSIGKQCPLEHLSWMNYCGIESAFAEHIHTNDTILYIKIEAVKLQLSFIMQSYRLK